MKKVFCVLAVLMLLLSGCAMGEQSPKATPDPTQTAPSRIAPTTSPTPAPENFLLPEALQEGGESVLSVYDTEQETIREMKLEKYLTSVVAGEMPTNFPEQALMAQAVVARTFLVNFLATKGGSQVYPGADISTDIEESQAFAEEKVVQAVHHAVELTRGMILTHEGRAIHAWFHAASGGRTATAAEGLSFDREETPYIVSVESDESGAPEEVVHWQAEFTRQELEKALQQVLGKVPEFSTVAIQERGESGRVTAFSFSGTRVSANALRLALGSTKFRSTLLSRAEFSGDTWSLSGSGYGHGVGMSQWGAAQMARAGKDAFEILAHYYPGTRLTKIWE